MGLFDFFGGNQSGRNKQVSFGTDGKLNRQDIIDLVWSIQSLNEGQRAMVKDKLLAEMDDDGVSKWEYKELVRWLAERREEFGLSEIDIKNLKRVLH